MSGVTQLAGLIHLAYSLFISVGREVFLEDRSVRVLAVASYSTVQAIGEPIQS